MTNRLRLVYPLFPVLLLLFSSCSVVSVSERSIPDVVKRYQVNAVSDKKLSLATTQYLRTHNLDSAQAKDRAAFFQSLVETQDEDRLERMHALAEFALLQAILLDGKRRAEEEAANWYLLAAEQAYEGLFGGQVGETDGAFDYRYQQLRLYYNRAVAGFVLSLKRKERPAFHAHTRTFLGESFAVTIAAGQNLWDPDEFEELLLAFELDFQGITNHYRRSGLGAAFVGYRKNEHQTPVDEFYALLGFVRPLSVVLTFEPAAGVGQKRAALAFYDSRDIDTIPIAGRSVPLAADFTAPIGYLLSKSKAGGVNIAGTINSEAALETAGFRLVDPFDPQRIPLITIHGLLSSPLTWIDVHNDLMADPVIRKNYQIWHFSYPPGLPVLISAQLFRKKINQLYDFFDPEGKFSALRKTVVIAHSMGGLLTKTVVANSESTLWNRTFTVPPEELKLSPEYVAELLNLAFFERKPYIKRAVFIAVPHRGSSLADSFIGKLGRTIISAPRDTLRLLSQLRAHGTDYLRPEFEATLKEDPSSVASLSPLNPAIQALAAIAVEKSVPFHSIIGDRGLGEGPQSSDGVVPYSSSHLAGAESELIVPTDHGAHHHPLAILELKRILKLHLQEAKGS